MASSFRKETAWLVIGDLACLVLSVWIALTVRNLALPDSGFLVQHLVAFVPIFLVSLLIFFVAGLYEKQTRLVRMAMGGRILGAQVASILVGAVLFFLLPSTIAPKTVLVLYLATSVVLVSGWRFAAIPRFSAASRENVALIGEGAALTELIEELNNNHRYTVRVAVHISPLESAMVQERVTDARAHGISTFVIDTRNPHLRHALPELSQQLLRGATFIEFSTLYEDVFDRVPLAHIDDAWMLECLPKRHPAYEVGKRAFDVACASIIGIVVAPLVFIVALILAPSGQPFIFHDRVGREGKTFRIVKLRSMLFDDHGNPELQKKNRITVFGQFLRKTRIDELPQLVNILLGDLSFIGPRPELPAIASTYEREIPYYNVRHLIVPGLSGWAQIWDYDAPRGPADVERTKRKLSYDLYYLKRRSFVLDLIIFLKTLRALASFSGK